MFISRGEPLVRRPAVVKAAEATKSTREAVAPPCRKPPEFCLQSIENHSVSIIMKSDYRRASEREREQVGDRRGQGKAR